MEEVSKEDWIQWRDNPVTRKVFGIIQERREETIQRLAFGEGSGSMSKQNIMIGALNAYTHMLNIRFEEEI